METELLSTSKNQTHTNQLEHEVAETTYKIRRNSRNESEWRMNDDMKSTRPLERQQLLDLTPGDQLPLLHYCKSPSRPRKLGPLARIQAYCEGGTNDWKDETNLITPPTDIVSKINSSVLEALRNRTGQARIERYSRWGDLYVTLPGTTRRARYDAHLYGSELLLYSGSRIKSHYRLKIDELKTLTIIGERELALRAELKNGVVVIFSANNLLEWVTSIKVLFITMTNKPSSWMYPPISSEGLCAPIPSILLANNVQDGDLILFSTRSRSGPIIRKASRSPFDHVGIIARTNCRDWREGSTKKFPSRRLSFLHAVAGQGVVMTCWGCLLEHEDYRDCSNVVVRKLRCPRWSEPSIRRRLRTFIDQANKMKNGYSILPHKIFAKSATYQDPFHPKRTYFCSSLVAEAYQQVGLLRKSLNSANYWPNSFTQSFGIELLRGCSLGPEIKVDFSDAVRSNHHLRKVH